MKDSSRPVRVAIFQPVVPEYRVPFFTALHARPELDVQVFASWSAPGSPETPRCSFGFPFHPVRFIPFLGNQVAWQTNLHIPLNFEPGDVLVVCGNPRYLSNYPLIFAARRRRIGIVWWGIWHYPESKRWAVWARKQLLRLPHVVLTYSDREVEELIDAGIPPERLFAANNTVSTDAITRARDQWAPQAFRNFLTARGMDDRQYVLYCGRLTRKPEVHVAIEALHILRRRGVPVDFVIIGDGPERAVLCRQAFAMGIGGHVHWLGAVYDQGILAPWFLGALSLVYPGAIGLTIFHAFAYGLPVITHGDVRAQPPEFFALQEGFNGLYFKKGDATDLADKIEVLAKGSERRKQMGINALETVQSRYSSENMVERFVKAVKRASSAAKEEARLND